MTKARGGEAGLDVPARQRSSGVGAGAGTMARVLVVDETPLLGRQDQLRTAETLDVIRRLDEFDPATTPSLSTIVGEVFDAEVALVTDRDARANLTHRCSDPEAAECHAAIAVRSGGGPQGSLRLCRSLPFSASERRLAAILATTAARVLENRRLPGTTSGRSR